MGHPAGHHPMHEPMERLRNLVHRLVINSERAYRGAPEWSADTIAVPASPGDAALILTRHPGRRYAYVANVGANAVSFAPSKSLSPGGPGTFTLAAGGPPRRLDTTAEVWARSTAGTTVDVITYNDPDD